MMLRLTSTLPLLLAVQLGGWVAIAGIAWLAHEDVHSFEQQQFAEMERSAADAGIYVQNFIRQRKVLVQAFAQDNAALLADVVRDPENEERQSRLATKVDQYFPSHFAHVARRSDGEFVPDNFGEYVGEACRVDMHSFADEIARSGPRKKHPLATSDDHVVDADYLPVIHPQPFNYHFDLTAPWAAPDGTEGLLMISFSPEQLVRILAAHETPHHKILLLRSDVDGLIEATSGGWRETINREGRLAEAELEFLTPRVPVEGARWQVAYLPDTAYLASYRNGVHLSAAVATAVILLFMGVMTWWYIASERARREAKAKEALLLRQVDRDRAELEALIDVIPIPIFRRDGDGRIDLLNDAYAGLVGMNARDLIGRTVNDIYGPATAQQVQVLDSELAEQVGRKQVYERSFHPPSGGPERHVVYHKTSMLLDGDKAPSIVGAAVDVTEERALRAELESLAATDSLTGLANRRKFTCALESEIDRARRTGHPTALVMLDIDHFKRVNDTHGHDMGDEVIKAVAARMAGAARANIDLPARLGGEEFALLLPETDQDGAIRFAERLRQIIEDLTIRHNDKAVSVTVSLGVTMAAADGSTSPEMLLKQSDEALYAAKQAGRNRVTAYSARQLKAIS